AVIGSGRLPLASDHRWGNRCANGSGRPDGGILAPAVWVACNCKYSVPAVASQRRRLPDAALTCGQDHRPPRFQPFRGWRPAPFGPYTGLTTVCGSATTVPGILTAEAIVMAVSTRKTRRTVALLAALSVLAAGCGSPFPELKPP